MGVLGRRKGRPVALRRAQGPASPSAGALCPRRAAPDGPGLVAVLEAPVAEQLLGRRRLGGAHHALIHALPGDAPAPVPARRAVEHGAVVEHAGPLVGGAEELVALLVRVPVGADRQAEGRGALILDRHGRHVVDPVAADEVGQAGIGVGRDPGEELPGLRNEVLADGTTDLDANGDGDIRGAEVLRFAYGLGCEADDDACPGAVSDHSLTRSPDVLGAWVPHDQAEAAGAAVSSAGTRVDGTPFGL